MRLRMLLPRRRLTLLPRRRLSLLSSLHLPNQQRFLIINFLSYAHVQTLLVVPCF
jgi:hypothetical protein